MTMADAQGPGEGGHGLAARRGAVGAGGAVLGRGRAAGQSPAACGPGPASRLYDSIPSHAAKDRKSSLGLVSLWAIMRTVSLAIGWTRTSWGAARRPA